MDINIPKTKVIDEEESFLFAKYYHPQSDDYLDYKTKIQIKDSGKTPVHLNLEFDGILPSFAPMPPKKHIIKAKSILDFSLKIKRWLEKYGYEQI